MADDDYPLKLLGARFHHGSIDQLYLLGTQYLAAGRRAEATECQEQLRKRINDRAQARAFGLDSYAHALKQYVELAAATEDYDPRTLTENVRRVRRSIPNLFPHFLIHLASRNDLEPLMALVQCPLLPGMRAELELASIRTAGACGAQIHQWPEFRRFRRHPISACWALLYAPTHAKPYPIKVYAPELDVPAYDAKKPDVERFLHTLFFSVLAGCLRLRGADPVVERSAYDNRKWLATAVQSIYLFATTAGKLLVRGEHPPFGLGYRLFQSLSVPHGYDAFTDYVPFRQSLLTISIDLFLLTSARSGQKVIPLNEWQRARNSPHFLFSDWVERYVSARLRLMAPGTVEFEIDQELRKTTSSVTPFNERVQSYIELCELALHQQCLEQANEILRRAFACVIGYGWRKDPALAHVLSAIEAVADIDNALAKRAVRDLSPIIARIGDMTEDAGARESDLSDLLLKVMPHTYVAYYDFWLKASEWYTAERVFAAALGHMPLAGSLMQFATSAVWDAEAVAELKKRAGAGDLDAVTILEANAQRFGLPPDELGKKRSRDTSEPESEQGGIAIHGYGPDDLQKLLDEIAERKLYVGASKVVASWFQHWKEQGQGIRVLRALEVFIPNERAPFGIGEIFDDAFHVSLQLEGREKAYRWIVAAQIHQHGWEHYHGLGVATARFALFATNYANRWAEFIADTTDAHGFGSERLVIPHDRLVLFLLAVNQTELAARVAEVMLSTTVDDFQDQPLQSPGWLLKGKE